MAYIRHLEQAARRHYKAAETLLAATPTDRQNECDAGYLLGFAAECALKQMMLKSGISPSKKDGNRAYWDHFPELKNRLLDEGRGRYQAHLLKFARDPSLMAHWHFEMRYSQNADIQHGWIANWKADARNLINSMEAH